MCEPFQRHDDATRRLIERAVESLSHQLQALGLLASASPKR
jgi:hypothetical protein